MTRQALFLVGALTMTVLGAPRAIAEPTLQLTTPESVEYGRPLTLHIIGRDLGLSLRDYRPTALSNLFHVDSFDYARDENLNQQTLTVRAYPRAPGRVEVPRLVFQDLSTQPSTVFITEARDRKTGQPINVAFGSTPATVWLRQAIAVNVSLTIDDPVVALNTPLPPKTTWHVEPVPAETVPAEQQSYSHRTGWHILALRAGRQTLQLPALELVRDGVVTHRFYPSPLSVDVKPLPPYLPATVPVGTAQIDATMPQQWWLREDALHSLKLTVTGTGVLPEMLPPVASQLHSNADIVFYPPTVEFRTQVTADALRSSAEIVVPFRTQSSGRVALPDLRLQWFDPASGQLRSVTQPLRLPLSLSLPWLISIFLATGLAASLVVYLSAVWLHSALHRLDDYRRALRALNGAKTPHDLRAALKQVAEAEGWRCNTTLQAWYASWSTRYGSQHELATSLDHLQRLLYAARDTEAAQLDHETFRHSIRQAHPLVARLALIPRR